MTMALCAVLAAPPRLRPTVAAIGSAYAVAVAYSILTLGWHFPSDVFGGYLVASIVRAAGDRRDQRLRGRAGRAAAAPRRRRGPGDGVGAILVGLAAAAVAGGALLARPHQLLGYAASHTTFTLGALAIAALAALIAGVMALGLPRRVRSRTA